MTLENPKQPEQLQRAGVSPLPEQPRTLQRQISTISSWLYNSMLTLRHWALIFLIKLLDLYRICFGGWVL